MDFSTVEVMVRAVKGYKKSAKFRSIKLLSALARSLTMKPSHQRVAEQLVRGSVPFLKGEAEDKDVELQLDAFNRNIAFRTTREWLEGEVEKIRKRYTPRLKEAKNYQEQLMVMDEVLAAIRRLRVPDRLRTKIYRIHPIRGGG